MPRPKNTRRARKSTAWSSKFKQARRARLYRGRHRGLGARQRVWLRRKTAHQPRARQALSVQDNRLRRQGAKDGVVVRRREEGKRNQLKILKKRGRQKYWFFFAYVLDFLRQRKVQTMKKKPKIGVFYTTLSRYYNRAKKLHPRSNVAFDPGNGSILFHRKDHKQFGTELQKLRRKEAKLDPGNCVAWKRNNFPQVHQQICLPEISGAA